MLEPLGLDQHSERVYVAILSQPGITAEWLAERLDLSSCEVECALDRLKKLTLLQMRSEDEGFYAISPEHGMEILLAVQQAELASFQQRVELSRAAAARLIAEHINIKPDNATPEVEYLTGIDAMRVRLEALSAGVRSEVMNFSPTKQTQADVSAGKEATLRYMGTKVRSRSIYSHSALRDPATLEYMQWLVRNGFELGSTPALPSRMVIFDRKIALLPMSPEDSRKGRSSSTARRRSPPSARSSTGYGSGPYRSIRARKKAMASATPSRSRSSGCSPRGTRTRRSLKGWG